RIDVESSGAPSGVGTVNHCVHGKQMIREEILDWKPFDYCTFRVSPSGLVFLMTIELEPSGSGTTAHVRMRPESKGRKRALEPLADADRAALIEGWERTHQDGGEAVYGVFVDGKPIGGTGLHKRRGPNGLEIGYWMDKDHTNKGIATEVARMLTTAALALPGI